MGLPFLFHVPLGYLDKGVPTPATLAFAVASPSTTKELPFSLGNERVEGPHFTTVLPETPAACYLHMQKRRR